MSKKHKYNLATEDVRKFTDEEIGIEVEAQRGKLFTARSQAVTEKVEDHSQFKAYKRNVARLLTEQNARRHKAAPKPAAKAAATPAKQPAAKTAAKSGAKPAATSARKSAKQAATK